MNNDSGGSQKVDPSKLHELYPVPKTYDEKLAERTEIDSYHRSQYTKHPRLKIICILAMIVLGFIGVIYVASKLFLGSPMVGVPLTLLSFLVWVYGVRVAVAAIRTTAYTNPHL